MDFDQSLAQIASRPCGYNATSASERIAFSGHQQWGMCIHATVGHKASCVAMPSGDSVFRGPIDLRPDLHIRAAQRPSLAVKRNLGFSEGIDHHFSTRPQVAW